MKILIGVDDSPHSNAAVDFVRRMAWPKDTKISVISVVQPAVPAYTEIYVPVLADAELHEELVRRHQDIASGAEASLRGGGLGTEARVLTGDPRVALVEAARSERADLIVVGSHGRTGIAKLVMGSVASHVVTHAPCSVLVVKLEAR
jgi:nucleotide-binding universal stress UspA family protein